MKTKKVEKDGVVFEFEFLDHVSDETVNSVIKDALKEAKKKMKKALPTGAMNIQDILISLGVKK